MKPIIEKRADAARIAGNSTGGKSSPISDATPDIFTNELPVSAPAPTPIRTDTQVAALANLGKDTIRKIEQIESIAEPKVKALAAAGDVSINLASQFIDLPAQDQQEAIAAIAENSDTAKEVMREAVKKAHVAHNPLMPKNRRQHAGAEWYSSPQVHIKKRCGRVWSPDDAGGTKPQHRTVLRLFCSCPSFGGSNGRAQALPVNGLRQCPG
jgi:hypothetical protein